MNHQKYDALGIRVNNLLASAESAKCQNATNPGQISGESAAPEEEHHPLCPNHPDDDQSELLGSFATVCPKCGAQTMDPFTGTKQIHDVERCNGKARHD